MLIDIIGYAAGTIVLVSLLPQMIKSMKTKSTKDLSLCRYAMYTFGLFLWVVYAVMIKNGPVGIMNGIGVALAGVILALKIKHG